ncbi:hypothetical protein U1Q18_047446, partial [Sarracenia purpurea var. burkii]
FYVHVKKSPVGMSRSRQAARRLRGNAPYIRVEDRSSNRNERRRRDIRALNKNEMMRNCFFFLFRSARRAADSIDLDVAKVRKENRPEKNRE